MFCRDVIVWRLYRGRDTRTHHAASLLSYLTTKFMSEAKKKGTWELVLKIIIAVASAIAGALGTAACQGRL